MEKVSMITDLNINIDELSPLENLLKYILQLEMLIFIIIIYVFILIIQRWIYTNKSITKFSKQIIEKIFPAKLSGFLIKMINNLIQIHTHFMKYIILINMIVLIFSIILCIYTTNEIYSNIDEYIDVYLHYKLIKKSISIIPMCLLLRNKNMQVTKFNQIMNKNNEKIKGINNYSSNLVEREGENKFNNVNSDNKNRDGGVENIKIFKVYC